MGGGGGGGDTNIQPRVPGQEQPVVGNWYDFQKGQYNDFLQNNPLLQAAQTGALANFGNLGSLTAPLAALSQQAPGFYGGLQNQLGGISGQIGNLLSGLPNINALTNPLRQTFGALGKDFGSVVQPVIAGGGYSPEIDRLAAQRSRIASAAAGTAHTLGGIGREVLSRQDVQDQRLANYIGMGQQLAGAQGGLAQGIQGLIGANTGLRSGLLGQQAGIAGQRGGLFGQQGTLQNLLSAGQQGLQTGGLNQLLGVGNAGVNQFSTLTNPILGYLGNLFQGNLQSRIAGAQIGAQQDIAGDNKTSGAIGGGISAIGSIAAIAL